MVLSWEIYARCFNYSRSPEKIEFDLYIIPAQESYKESDNFMLNLDLRTPSTSTTSDLYFVMLDPANKLYFGVDWVTTPHEVSQNITLPGDFSLTGLSLMEITIPDSSPSISESGTYIFAIAAAKPGTIDWISNIATVSFMVE